MHEVPQPSPHPWWQYSPLHPIRDGDSAWPSLWCWRICKNIFLLSLTIVASLSYRWAFAFLISSLQLMVLGGFILAILSPSQLLFTWALLKLEARAVAAQILQSWEFTDGYNCEQDVEMTSAIPSGLCWEKWKIKYTINSLCTLYNIDI